MHPDDEALSAYADDPEGAPGAKQIAEHLAVCPDCAGFVLSVRELDAILSSADTWAYAEERRATTGVPEELLEILRATVAEDEEAKELLEPLLRNPLVFLWTDLAAKPRFRTAGVVRRLCQEVVTACEVDPPHARDLAEAAMLVAETLDRASYGEEELSALQGAVWKARATALRRLGDLPGALAALERADHELRKLNPHAVAFADIAYIRADVLSAMGRLDEASREAQTATELFAAQGRIQRYIDARLTSGAIAFRRGEFRAARDIFAPLLDQAEADGNLELVARLSQNLGATLVELNETALASKYLVAAVTRWEAVGKPLEAARSKWSLAKLLVALGKYDEAAERLAAVQQLFTDSQKADDTALVRLQRVEALLLAGRRKEAERVCKGLVAQLMDLGIKPAAYRALAHVQQLAATGKLSASEVRMVETFICDLRTNPNLAFRLPPG